MKKMTYAESGVDIQKEEKAIKQLVSQMSSTRQGIGKPLGGHYAGMVEFGEFALVLCTDGVGSKVLIASTLKKWDTVGIDCVAMNVNDAICMGAEPLAFVDYLAINDPKPTITKQIGIGLQKAAVQSNISIIGGETASLPELINGFDLAGTCLSYVKKEDIITGDLITEGDVIIGLKSSGLHSNGYTLARKVILQSPFTIKDEFPEGYYPGKTIGEVLLEPTRIYVKEILSLLNRVSVHGLAHITGGGLKNLNRLNTAVKFELTDIFEPQDVFSFIKKQGNIDDEEMYKTFNMGMGFAVIVPSEEASKAIRVLSKNSEMDVKKVGHITEGSGVVVPSLNLCF